MEPEPSSSRAATASGASQDGTARPLGSTAPVGHLAVPASSSGGIQPPATSASNTALVQQHLGPVGSSSLGPSQASQPPGIRNLGATTSTQLPYVPISHPQGLQPPASITNAAYSNRPGTPLEPQMRPLRPVTVPLPQPYRAQQQFRPAPQAPASLVNGTYLPYSPRGYVPRQQVPGARPAMPPQLQQATPPFMQQPSNSVPLHLPPGAYPLPYQGPLPANGSPQQISTGFPASQSAGLTPQQLPVRSASLQAGSVLLQPPLSGPPAPQQMPPAAGTPRFPVSLAQLGIHAPPGRGLLAGGMPPPHGIPHASLGPYGGAAGRPAFHPQGTAPALPAGWRGYQHPPPGMAQVPRGPSAPASQGLSLSAPASMAAGLPTSAPKRPSQRKGQNSANAKKHCNCKNSRCLKLYCECFASGRYCDNCNCVSCCNNKENEGFRQAAVETILDRNPNAFRPKIQEREGAAAAIQPARHNKGCNCKKSGCLKKYCECFQASIYCSENCKCVDCKNYNVALGPKAILASPKHSLKAGKAPASQLHAGSFTEAMKEAIMGSSQENSAVVALHETMQEISKGNGIAEMAKLLMLVAEEEAEALKQREGGAAPKANNPDRTGSADGGQASSPPLEPANSLSGQPAVGAAHPERSTDGNEDVSPEYVAQERAVLGEFQGFLEKLVRKVKKRAVEHEVAAGLRQASASSPQLGANNLSQNPHVVGQSSETASPQPAHQESSPQTGQTTSANADDPEPGNADVGPDPMVTDSAAVNGKPHIPEDVEMTADETLTDNSNEALALNTVEL